MKFAVVFLIATGCMKQSEKYCAMHPEDLENCSGSGGDGGAGCLGNDECIAIDPTNPVCTETSECVQCTVEDDALCTEGRVCRGTACGDCVAHSECDSNVCQANGRCADTTMVAYVAPNGSGDECTQAMPCSDAIIAETTARPIIKISGTITNPGALSFDARSTTIYAEPGAALTRTGPGAVVEASGPTAELTIYDLRIFGGTGAGLGHGVQLSTSGGAPTVTLDRVVIDNNDGSGVRAFNGGDVTIRRSVIANNYGNQGIFIQGTFSITNTVIAQNGKTSLLTGGAVLDAQGPSTFEFNTVADNVTMGGATNYRGISCSPGLDVSNCLIIGNDTSMCDVTYSMFSPGDMPSGTGNMTGDPIFKSTTMPATPNFYRITPSSPAKDKADAAATLDIDIDGNMRPIDGRSDMGADEVAP